MYLPIFKLGQSFGQKLYRDVGGEHGLVFVTVLAILFVRWKFS
jgi:tetrahydromethanopterin S-methyltransferase subunit G